MLAVHPEGEIPRLALRPSLSNHFPVRSRSFLTRLTLAALGMLLLCLFGGVGLSWAVRKNPEWLVKLLGFDRCASLRSVSVCTLGTLLPADSDGDGIADSVERYLGSDPHNPLSHPSVDLSLEDLGFNYLMVALQPGDRRRIRARAHIDDGPAVFAPGMRIRFNPEPPGLVCLPGGTPSGNPLLVPVAADGAMEFDLAIRDDAVPFRPMEPYEVEASHPLSDGYAGRLNFDVVWRLPPLACTMKEIPFTGNVRGSPVDDVKGWRSARLTWQLADSAGTYYIEATREQSGDPQWLVVDLCTGEDHDRKVSYRLSDSDSSYRGPIRFRIIPTKRIPPRPADDTVEPLSAYRLRQSIHKGLFQFSYPYLNSIGYTVVPVASIADSPESAEAILRNIIDTQLGLLVGPEMNKAFIITDVSRLEPTVSNGFYVFQVITKRGLRIIILDSAKPQAAVQIWGRVRPVADSP